MNLKSLQDKVLLDHTFKLVQEERERLIVLLRHLKEIQDRRLFSSLGYKSLFDFCVRRIGYSEDQAYRRISAMKLIKEIPEVGSQLSTGKLNLTHINLAQSLFKREALSAGKAFSREEKIEVLEKISDRPTREAEKIIFEFSSEPMPGVPDQIKLVGTEVVEIKFQAPQELQNKIEKLKGLLAHKNPSLSLAELFDQLCDLGLQKYSPTGDRTQASANTPAAVESAPRVGSAASKKSCVISKNESLSEQKSRQGSQKISVALKREVFQQAQEKCENCGSHYALEIDHIIPRALGGPNEKNNLRILCRLCNQRAAIQALGREKMEKYLERRH